MKYEMMKPLELKVLYWVQFHDSSITTESTTSKSDTTSSNKKNKDIASKTEFVFLSKKRDVCNLFCYPYCLRSHQRTTIEARGNTNVRFF